MKLSVIIPVYNERHTLEPSVRAVLAVNEADEILIIDDGSTDGTRDLYPAIQALDESIIRIILHEKNQGKGAAVRTGFAEASGDIFLIQDADLEYDPRDYRSMLRPIEEGGRRWSTVRASAAGRRRRCSSGTWSATRC